MFLVCTCGCNEDTFVWFRCNFGALCLNNVVKPLADFESKIEAEGVAHRVRGEFTFSNLAFVVDTEQKEQANVEADLEQLGTASPFLQTKIYDLVGSTAATEADLKAATVIQATGTQTSQSPSWTLIRSLPRWLLGRTRQSCACNLCLIHRVC